VSGTGGGISLFPTGRKDMNVAADRSRSLQAWLWAMVIAPFVPWYTFPFPMALFIAAGVVAFPTALISGTQPAFGLVAFGALSFVGVVWIITAFLTFLSSRRGEWQKALWFALTNLVCGVTVLGTSLVGTGFGPVEPFGYLTPLAFLSLAALPAAYMIAGRWLQDLANRSGPIADRAARSRLLVLGVGYAVVFVTSFAAVVLSAAGAIQRLPVPHFYYEEQLIRESASVTFAIVSIVSLAAFVTLAWLLLRPRTAGPRTA